MAKAWHSRVPTAFLPFASGQATGVLRLSGISIPQFPLSIIGISVSLGLRRCPYSYPREFRLALFFFFSFLFSFPLPLLGSLPGVPSRSCHQSERLGSNLLFFCVFRLLQNSGVVHGSALFLLVHDFLHTLLIMPPAISLHHHPHPCSMIEPRCVH
ncbi:hypothetical protein IWZ03DRAFT_51844 [Phyllosticta citriasiana]|uniref:Uncharacterized protein n=1 Tax=Phyllosticta citriasiana TaxID=595635 RepID=A0ABR1KHH5_9PEZI